MLPEEILLDGIKAAVERVNFTLQNAGRAFEIQVIKEIEQHPLGDTPIYSIKLALVLPEGYKFSGKERNQKSNRIRTLYEFRHNIEFGNPHWELDYLAAFMAYLFSFAVAGHGSPVAARIEASANDVVKQEELGQHKEIKRIY